MAVKRGVLSVRATWQRASWTAVAVLLFGVLVMGLCAAQTGVARGAGPGTVTLNLWPAGQGRIDAMQNGAPVGSCDILSIVADSVPCPVDVVPGVPVTLTATAIPKADLVFPDPDLLARFTTDLPDFQYNYQPSFVRWTVFGCEGTNPCTFTPVEDDEYVGAIFTPLQLEIGVNGPGAVVAQRLGGNGVDVLPCDAGLEFGQRTCHGLYPADATVVLLASSQPLAWNSDCDPTLSSPASLNCTVVMNNVRTFAAVSFADADPPPPADVPAFPFQIATRVRVVLGGTGHGRVTGSGFDCGASCTTKPFYQDPLTLQATPDPGSEFVRWQGVCSTSPTCSFSAGSATIVQAVFDVPATPAATTTTTTPTAETKKTAGTKITARLGSVRLKHRAGRRVLELPVFLDGTASVTVRLSRRGRTILLQHRTLHSGRNVLRLKIPKKLKPGRCQLSVRLAAGDVVRTLPISVPIGR
jgi:hypothetical protein